MKAVTIEFLRFGGPAGAFNKGDRYLVASQSDHPVRDLSMPLGQAQCGELMQPLRDVNASYQKARASLDELGTLVATILDPPAPGNQFLQLDVVTSAAELWTLPFEAVTRGDGPPLLVDPERRLVLTRRVRHPFADRVVPWPIRPNVLFITASPSGFGDLSGEVPRHVEALLMAVRPWTKPREAEDRCEIAPDSQAVLQVVRNATRSAVKEACRKASQAGRPFTHVHVLAHGVLVVDPANLTGYRFDLALQPEAGRPGKYDPVDAKGLADALGENGPSPVAVTLCVCNSADATNTIQPGSLAGELHQQRIPVVIASQLPFTYDGAALFTRVFYNKFVSGVDVREALHEARLELYKARATTLHDWMGLVAYVQLPEGYADHLSGIRLEMAMEALKTAQRWSDGFVDDADLSDWAERLLRDGIGRLKGFLKGKEKSSFPKGVYVENLGLLGSANKRLAELLRHRDAGSSRKALQSSWKWYRHAQRHDLASHWTGTQFLALEAILLGRIPHLNHWDAFRGLAAAESEKKKEVWAWGSLVELYLLAPLAGKPKMLDEACEALTRMSRRAGSDDRFPVESTARQLRRYVDWWTKKNGFFPGRAKDLAEDARSLLQFLDSLQHAPAGAGRTGGTPQ